MPLLRQVSPSDPVSQMFLQGLEEGCPIIRDDALCHIKGGDLDRQEDEQDASATDLTSRALYGAKTAETYTPTYSNVTKYIFWGKVETDPVVEQRHGAAEADAVLKQRTLKQGRMRGRRLQELMLIGSNSDVSTDFNGFSNLVGASQILTGDDGGVVLPLGGDDVKHLQQAAIERIIKVGRNIRARLGMSATVKLYANSEFNTRLLMVARALNMYREKDIIGNEIDNLLGWIVPRDVGVDNSYADLLPWTETYNDGNSTSIYMVGWGEGPNMVNMPTSAGLVGVTKQDEDGNLYNSFDLDIGLGKQDPYALWRITGWKKS